MASYGMVSGAPVLARLTASLGADVALNNTGTYFDGPSVAQGTTGTWFASGSIVVNDTGGAANINVKLWDGTTVIDSGRFSVIAANKEGPVALSGYITNPAGNIRISAQDATATTGVIVFNDSTGGKDSTLTVLRVG